MASRSVVSAVVDGILVSGRLVRAIAPERRVKLDGTISQTYSALVILAHDETVKVEYREVEDLLGALAGALPEKFPVPGPTAVFEDGAFESLPRVTLRARAIGQWDAVSKTFGQARFQGVK